MAKLTLHPDTKGPTINKNIYGHFAEHLGRCIYEGIWVGEDSPIPNTRGIRNDVVEALKAIGIPVLRWPGGCFADEYHWKDGIGPKDSRKRMINTHWGGVVENNHFGTHEFLDLCGLLGCEPCICGNVGSGTVQEMSEWVEYMTFDGESPMAEERKRNGRELPWKVKYFGVGNENWGCGGSMRPEYYADLYRRYQTYCRNYGGNKLFRIACGPNSDDYNWTEVMMRETAWCMDGLSLHYYTLGGKNWEDKSPATGFNGEQYFKTMKNALHMEELIERHSAIMDKYDPDKKVALIVDEWGNWHMVEPGTNPGFLYQQNTMRDALSAGLHLNIFNNHCDRVRMANIAQMVNVLQSVILTEGREMVLTPTYHVFGMYKVHQDAAMVRIELESEPFGFGGESIPGLSASASIDGQGTLNLTLCNVDPEKATDMELDIQGRDIVSVSGSVLTGNGMDSHNTFESPLEVVPKEFGESTIKNGGAMIPVPPLSVLQLAITLKG